MRHALKSVLAAASLAACTHSPLDGPPLEPAPLPNFTEGETLIWSSGRAETVMRVRDGDVVDWQDNYGNSFSTRRNFLLPSLAWDHQKTRATTEIMAEPDLLWPLQTGNRRLFRVAQRLTLKIHNSTHAFLDEWGCRVDGTERVSVPLGDFDTYRLRCSRYWSGSILGEITWNYAPELGRVVRRKFSDLPEAEELVAVGPAGLEEMSRDSLDGLRDEALEMAPSGVTLEDRKGLVRVAVTPTATYRTDTGAWCRRYTKAVEVEGRRSLRAEFACRDADGRWRQAG